MDLHQRKSISLPVGVVVRRLPGVTRWAKWVWTPVSLLPGAGPANWKVLCTDGDAVEYHAGTVPLTLYRGEAEAYKIGLSEATPCVYVVLRAAERGPHPYIVHMVTASPHEGQMYAESGEELVEKLPMPDGMIGWVAAWADAHYVEDPFVKRKRRKHMDAQDQDGIGDARIRQITDVYRAPGTTRKAGDT